MCLYEALWDSATRVEDQYQACIVAHFMAHAHVEPVTQLDWHLRALHAADAVGDERVRGFYPSLYANLGETCLRLGDLTRAGQYTEMARAAEQVLPNDFYGRMIRSLIARITEAVEEGHALTMDGGTLAT
jgi:hypothetical protein